MEQPAPGPPGGPEAGSGIYCIDCIDAGELIDDKYGKNRRSFTETKREN
jgi:hypothetical protein